MMLNMTALTQTTETPALPAARKLRKLRPLLAALLLLLLLAACAPQVMPPPASNSERAAQDTALVIYHRMQLGRLETGSYTTNALVDVELQRGLRWTVESFPGETYELRVSDDSLPGLYWEVTPAGVRRVQSISGQSSIQPAATHSEA